MLESVSPRLTVTIPEEAIVLFGFSVLGFTTLALGSGLTTAIGLTVTGFWVAALVVTTVPAVGMRNC